MSTKSCGGSGRPPPPLTKAQSGKAPRYSISLREESKHLRDFPPPQLSKGLDLSLNELSSQLLTISDLTYLHVLSCTKVSYIYRCLNNVLKISLNLTAFLPAFFHAL